MWRSDERLGVDQGEVGAEERTLLAVGKEGGRLLRGGGVQVAGVGQELGGVGVAQARRFRRACRGSGRSADQTALKALTEASSVLPTDLSQSRAWALTASGAADESTPKAGVALFSTSAAMRLPPHRATANAAVAVRRIHEVIVGTPECNRLRPEQPRPSPQYMSRRVGPHQKSRPVIGRTTGPDLSPESERAGIVPPEKTADGAANFRVALAAPSRPLRTGQRKDQRGVVQAPGASPEGAGPGGREGRTRRSHRTARPWNTSLGSAGMKTKGVASSGRERAV